MRTLTAILLLASAAIACGGEENPKNGAAKDPTASDITPGSFAAEDQTPGMYRDTYRLLAAIQPLTDDVAVDRLIQDLTHKLTATNDTSDIDDHTKDTLTGLEILALRSMQATATHPSVARDIGVHMLQSVLQLDPARVAWNQANPNDQVPVASAGAALIADAASYALTESTKAPVDAQGQPMTSGFTSSVAAECAAPSTRSADWSPGTGSSVWVNRYCYGAHWTAGYCEQGRWVDGQCYDVWVSTGSCGNYENNGYYDYQCYDSYNCDYVWVDDYIWVDQGCSNSSSGYYDQQCSGGHYEEGLCYPDTYNPGYCIPGHYEWQYPTGGWAFYSGPVDCQPVVSAQAAVAATTAKILSGNLSDDIGDDSWRAAVLKLVSASNVPDAGYVDAVRQILVAAKTPPTTEPN